VPRLRITKHAENDLVEIGTFIAKDSPANAARFIIAIEEHCHILATHPLIGRARNELLSGIRSISYGYYTILYCVLEDTVEVLRIIHSARDVKRVIENH
jgi:toxin ParE1/3/4